MTIPIIRDLESGKSLITVGLMRDYGFANKRIATNMNINPQNLWPKNNDNMPVRLSDFPSSKELWAMGKGEPPRVFRRLGYMTPTNMAGVCCS